MLFFQGKRYLKLLKSGFCFSLCSFGTCWLRGNYSPDLYTLDVRLQQNALQQNQLKMKSFYNLLKNGTCLFQAERQFS